jgi:hypothetical protein
MNDLVEALEDIIADFEYGKGMVTQASINKAKRAIAATQKSMQPAGDCICFELLNFSPDSAPNPDCPVHGAGFRS